MTLRLPYYVRLHKDLPQWGRLVDRLARPTFTSGEVEAVTGVSRKVITDWGKSELLYTFSKGQAIAKKAKAATGWRLFSIYDLWALAVFKNLRDWGTWLEKLRPTRGKPGQISGWQFGHSVPEYLYWATFYWVSRHPMFLLFGERFVGFAPAERSKERLPDGRWEWKAELYDDPTKSQSHVIRLLPLMDNVASAVSRPDFKIILTPWEVLEQRVQESPKSVLPEMWEIPVQFVLDGQRVDLDPLPKDNA